MFLNYIMLINVYKNVLTLLFYKRKNNKLFVYLHERIFTLNGEKKISRLYINSAIKDLENRYLKKHSILNIIRKSIEKNF